MTLDQFSQVLWYGIFVTPLFAFLIVRKFDLNFFSKLSLGFAITLILAGIFFLISSSIVFRDGLGP